MVMTIAELVAAPALGTRLLAGAGGMGRSIQWAHTCEVPDPWNFLSPGDLLLSDGYSFPAEADAQVAFIGELVCAGMAGLSLGADVAAPPLTPEAIDFADENDFPLLETRYSVPFVMLVRAVADTNLHGSGKGVARILRLYDALRRAHAGGSVDRLLDELSDVLGAELHVVSARSGRELLPCARPLAPETRAAVAAGVDSDTRRLPPLGRIETRTGALRVVPLVHAEGAVLLAGDRGEAASDLVILQHAATIAGLEVLRANAEAARRRARGTELCRQLLEGDVEEASAVRRLAAEGLGAGPWVAACVALDDDGRDDGDDGPVSALEDGGIALLRLAAGDHELAILAADDAPQLRGAAVEAGIAVGFGDPFRLPSRTSDAAREARWALDAARANGGGSADYGDQAGLFMPRTVAEGEAVVERVLGRVLAYDRERGAGLVASLSAYFAANRSWRDAAAALGIHKQTLVYRMQKVEELTGRSLRDLGDQTELFLALRTLRLLDR